MLKIAKQPVPDTNPQLSAILVDAEGELSLLVVDSDGTVRAIASDHAAEWFWAITKTGPTEFEEAKSSDGTISLPSGLIIKPLEDGCVAGCSKLRHLLTKKKEEVAHEQKAAQVTATIPAPEAGPPVVVSAPVPAGVSDAPVAIQLPVAGAV